MFARDDLLYIYFDVLVCALDWTIDRVDIGLWYDSDAVKNFCE